MPAVPRTLTATITYRFLDGSTRRFEGKPSYRLSYSHDDAVEQAREHCRVFRRETFYLTGVLRTND